MFEKLRLRVMELYTPEELDQLKHAEDLKLFQDFRSAVEALVLELSDVLGEHRPLKWEFTDTRLILTLDPTNTLCFEPSKDEMHLYWSQTGNSRIFLGRASQKLGYGTYHVKAISPRESSFETIMQTWFCQVLETVLLSKYFLGPSS